MIDYLLVSSLSSKEYKQVRLTELYEYSCGTSSAGLACFAILRDCGKKILRCIKINFFDKIDLCD